MICAKIKRQVDCFQFVDVQASTRTVFIMEMKGKMCISALASLKLFAFLHYNFYFRYTHSLLLVSGHSCKKNVLACLFLCAVG